MTYPNFSDGLAKLHRDQAKIAAATNAPAEGGRVDAAQAWHDAIGGRAKPQGFGDTQAAAASWAAQPFLTAEERAQAEAVKAAREASRPPTHTELRDALERSVK